LRTVDKGINKIEELDIPDELWELIEALDSGQEHDLPVDVLDLRDVI